MLFLLGALGAFLGGALYHPSNYDGLCYRLPRILMWWAIQAGIGLTRQIRDEFQRRRF